MKTTWHCFQSVGAQAAAVLTGRPSPAEVDDADLDRVVARIVADATMAACAPKRGPGYAWWTALNACFPNSPATHPSRRRRSASEVRGLIEGLFAPDDPGGAWPCWCCETPTSTRWGKSLWPLAAPISQLNTAYRDADGQAWGGVAVCRSCRIAAWAMPYASLHNGAAVVTVEVVDEQAAMEFARLVVGHTLAVIDARAERWPQPRVPDGVDELVRGVECHVHVWRNDNREPRLAVAYYSGGREVDLSPDRCAEYAAASS